MASFSDRYLERQKAFWNVKNEQSARFNRVMTAETPSETLWRASAERDLRTVLDGIAPQPSWTILDLGCGVGRILAELKGRYPFDRLIGVDLSEEMLRFTQKNIGENKRILLYANNGRSLQMIPDASIDFAYSVDVFIHICDVGVVLDYFREVCRVLKRNGLFRFNVWRFDPEKTFGNSLGGRFAKSMYKLGIWSAGMHRWSPGEEAEFNGNKYMLREIDSLIRKSGLTVCAIQTKADYFWCSTRKVPLFP